MGFFMATGSKTGEVEATTAGGGTKDNTLAVCLLHRDVSVNEKC